MLVTANNIGARMKYLFVIFMIVLLSACATQSKDITAVYVSPLQYQAYDCEQLGAEAGRLQGRITQSGGRLDEAASNDKGITAVGAILFWPSLFFIGGTKQQEAEYARLKGEYDAVQQAAIIKKCSLAVQPLPTTSPDQANNSEKK